MNRRGFLQQAVAATAAATLTQAARGGDSPASERIRAGFVGVGGRARALLDMFSVQGDVEVAAIAEIDPRHVETAMKLLAERSLKQPAVHEDFRRIVDDPSIDVLVVGTPDHWHAIPTILACQAGKDVYVEKPDGHNIVEGLRMVEAMRKHGRVVQMGNQARSDPGFLAAMDYIRSGKLGQVLVAKAWENAKQGSIGHPSDGDPPPGIDYNLWLGSAPKRAFNPVRFHGNWRWFFDYGSGDLGNDGVHRLDYARWGLDTALAARGEPALGTPRRVSAQGGKWYFDDMQEWPDTLQVTYDYSQPTDGAAADAKTAGGLLLSYEMRLWAPYPYHGEKEGAVLYGDQGYIVLGVRRWQAFDADNRKVAEGQCNSDAIPHVRNFLECVKSRQRPNSDLETVGHPVSLLCHAGNVAWRVGRTLEIDAETETFVNDDQANALRTRPQYRAPWTLPEV
ncbi:MAG: Gfo/Idh/MocA family oxidoreductase [Pirellulales bacterium]